MRKMAPLLFVFGSLAASCGDEIIYRESRCFMLFVVETNQVKCCLHAEDGEPPKCFRDDMVCRPGPEACQPIDFELEE